MLGFRSTGVVSPLRDSSHLRNVFFAGLRWLSLKKPAIGLPLSFDKLIINTFNQPRSLNFVASPKTRQPTQSICLRCQEFSAYKEADSLTLKWSCDLG